MVVGHRGCALLVGVRVQWPLDVNGRKFCSVTTYSDSADDNATVSSRRDLHAIVDSPVLQTNPLVERLVSEHPPQLASTVTVSTSCPTRYSNPI